jgi:Co/Zn/Cd efflux system component
VSEHCCAAAGSAGSLNDARWRRVLWIALGVNAAMFALEVFAGAVADSRALQADELDFLGDSANYAISLGVAGLALLAGLALWGGAQVVRQAFFELRSPAAGAR